MRSCRLSGHLIETWDQGWKSNSNNSWWSTVSHRLMWNHLVLHFLPNFSSITDYCPYLVLEFIQSSSRTILSNIRYLTPLRPERYPIDSRDPSFLFVFPMLGKSSQTWSKYKCIFLKRVVFKNHPRFESIAFIKVIWVKLIPRIFDNLDFKLLSNIMWWRFGQHYLHFTIHIHKVSKFKAWSVHIVWIFW